MECPKCAKNMVWERYSLSGKTDALSPRTGRVPWRWAWHCRCGNWVYMSWEEGMATVEKSA